MNDRYSNMLMSVDGSGSIAALAGRLIGKNYR